MRRMGFDVVRVEVSVPDRKDNTKVQAIPKAVRTSSKFSTAHLSLIFKNIKFLRNIRGDGNN